MKVIFRIIVLGFVSLWHPVTGQQTTTLELEEVVVSDHRLIEFSEGFKLEKLSDSILRRSGSLLTSTLGFNSNIYFRENGFGMVSSPAFRGTNASHTAVVWNGININSPLTGQTDFNTLSAFNYNNVIVKSGGSSVLYGTGAIGGSIHLNNELRFQKHFENRFISSYGSFNTRALNFKQDFGSEKWAYSLGVFHLGSDNDYRYLETDERNDNGEFDQWALNFNAGRKVGNDYLKLYHQSHFSDRNLSGTLVAPGRSRYKDNRHQTQLHYEMIHGKGFSQFRGAHLYERYRFFENKDNPIFSFGEVHTLLARYQLDLAIVKNVRLNTSVQYSNLSGKGTNLGNASRNELSSVLLIKHRLGKKFAYNLNARKDFTSDFDSPLVYGLNFDYRPSRWYVLKFNASRNFRIPTFNDLYWQPGGNLDLVPETSYQVDLGHVLSFGDVQFSLNGYYIDTSNMIRWLPDNTGLWSPSNVEAVTIYGFEGKLGMHKKINHEQSLEFELNAAYTISQDDETREQLIYVPIQRGTGSISYRWGRLLTFYQHLYTGPVSIIGGELEGYQVANIGLEYHSKWKNKWQYALGMTINNLYDNYYENVALRPMPNRNVQTHLTLNF